MKNRFARLLKSIITLACLIAITLMAGCIDITGKYTNELKSKEKELAALRHELEKNYSKLDEKDLLMQQLKITKRKLARVDNFIEKRGKK